MASIRCKGQSVEREDENGLRRTGFDTRWRVGESGRTLIFLPNFMTKSEWRGERTSVGCARGGLWVGGRGWDGVRKLVGELKDADTLLSSHLFP